MSSKSKNGTFSKFNDATIQKIFSDTDKDVNGHITLNEIDQDMDAYIKYKNQEARTGNRTWKFDSNHQNVSNNLYSNTIIFFNIFTK